MRYTNNTEIVQFMARAQARLGHYCLQALLEEEPEAAELYELLRSFLQSLDSPYQETPETELVRSIHFLNRRLNLLEIPFLSFPGYQTLLLQEGGPGSGLDEERVKQLIQDALSRLLHNKLKGLEPEVTYQGYVDPERYHISKDMYDFLWNLMNPYTAPTVGLDLTTTPAPYRGYYEKGTRITLSLLQGRYSLNSGKSVLSYAYQRAGQELIRYVAPQGAVASYADRVAVTQNTEFSFTTSFEQGGELRAAKSVQFVAPYYFGLARRGSTPPQIQALTKDFGPKPDNLPFTYVFPSNNADVAPDQVMTAWVLFPREWGIPSSIVTNTFQVRPGWSFQEVTYPLLDGTSQLGYLASLNTATISTYTFLFTWQ